MTDLAPVEILLVEDRLEDIEITMRALRKHNLANSIRVAHDGAEALEYLFESSGGPRVPPRVILLDLKLPKVSGIDVLRKLKSDERTRTIPVVVVTSSREEPDISTCYDLGANSYVVKPVDFDQFVDAMSSIGLYWMLINQPPQ